MFDSDIELKIVDLSNVIEKNFKIRKHNWELGDYVVTHITENETTNMYTNEKTIKKVWQKITHFYDHIIA